ncbi:alpha-galactosidase [Listeria booriae]|uniref:Alpha-galactosidase n=1 Tax=Listeria booriae TaxID=1552123 RepID=A0A7X0ZMQ3_9LIST|nr:alpha-galactosidase [Listeria booriae]MBC2283149.1 alpha-galactosidase [Listeria booriae]MBC2291852.1 alpha-galactosidase [Listeria booriae]MBC2304303.1 alpha-galactosidase [Listeria booriae]MBC2310436.1 alpha-galactosidase [Listeria booriae]
MSISYDETRRIFHLRGKDVSYVLGVVRDGYLAHLYYGKKLREYRGSNDLTFIKRDFSPSVEIGDETFSLDSLPQEYPQYGNTDFRKPAYQVKGPDGTTVSDLRYESHRIYSGKGTLDGLPATHGSDVDTIEITLVDEVLKLQVVLQYAVFTEYNIITRSARFINNGDNTLQILKAASASVDFKDSEYDLLTLPGAWGNERQIERGPIRRGIQSVESLRGASSHQQNPFIALLRKTTTEEQGDVYGFHFVYSGNFEATVEVDQFATTRVNFGIHSFNFNWQLKQGETFQTPEVVMVYSDKGLGDMSRQLHHFYQSHLLRGVYRDKERPILVNNWEATYFDFTEKKILDIAKIGSKLGMELLVLDDGWFGKRNSDKSSLGDWFLNKEKLPHGLTKLAEKINKLDMAFGLWFEPEMISVDSDLYRAHPDWCLHVPERRRSESRNQLVLDFSREDVRLAIVNQMTTILKEVPIKYVKWDMNRHLTEIGSAHFPKEQQQEIAHRHILGVYDVMNRITTEFPDILFESCSGGGGRFDPGMLYYMPQTWTSDNTDAISRLKIQYGTSLVYPIVTMGAHVSVAPNHQVKRHTSLEIRGNVAMSGNLGYELDLTKLTDTEKETIKQQIQTYKEIRPLIQFGDFYRLKSPFEGNETAWMFVDKTKIEAVVFYFQVLAVPAKPLQAIKLAGLNKESQYKINATKQVFGGDELMYSGLKIPTTLKGDFQTFQWHLTAKM